MKVVYRYLYMTEIADFALQTLREKSPVGSGRDPHPGLYRDTHTLFLNGRAVDTAKDWAPGDALHISNPAPYARKIEVGSMKMRVPGTDRVYWQAQQIIEARKGNLVTVKFMYMPVRFGDVALWAQFKKIERGGRRGRPEAQQEWLVRQPALQIMARG